MTERPATPLDGLLVLDFSKFLPGPYCTWLLANLGADILRIEHPRELQKQAAAFGHDPADTQALAARRARDPFAAGKRSLVLDPGDPANRPLLSRLLAQADILVEDYRPGTMARMGLGPETLLAAHPRLIYASVTLCGQHGPLAHKPGHDPIALALAGALDRVGENPDAPSFPGLPVADLLTGTNAALAILASLRTRDQTGRGRALDLAMSDAALPLTAASLARKPPGAPWPPRGERRADMGLWRCADGIFLVTTDMEPSYWARFCAALGLPGFIPLQHDQAARPAIRAALDALFASAPAATWAARLEAAGTQFALVLTPEEALAHPHMIARGMVVTRPLPDGSSQPQTGCPVRAPFLPKLAPAGPPDADRAAILADLAAWENS